MSTIAIAIAIAIAIVIAIAIAIPGSNTNRIAIAISFWPTAQISNLNNFKFTIDCNTNPLLVDEYRCKPKLNFNVKSRITSI